MSWLVEWKEYDPLTKEIAINSDSWDDWDMVVRIYNECIADALCVGAKVYCFMDGELYPSDDPVVLAYCP